mmetsp:Transcript_22389/g.53655  ORF Transcript_22389/g.53655 Transcript_22389/m.53655 type:complete len:212 (+) Transcript_22389:991-1626(+)
MLFSAWGLERSSTARLARLLCSIVLLMRWHTDSPLMSPPPPGDPEILLFATTEREFPMSSTLAALLPDTMLFAKVPEELCCSSRPTCLPCLIELCCTIGDAWLLTEIPAIELFSTMLCWKVPRAWSCSQTPYPSLWLTWLFSNRACALPLRPMPAHLFFVTVLPSYTPPASPSSTIPLPSPLVMTLFVKMGLDPSRTPTPASLESKISFEM